MIYNMINGLDIYYSKKVSGSGLKPISKKVSRSGLKPISKIVSGSGLKIISNKGKGCKNIGQGLKILQ